MAELRPFSGVRILDLTHDIGRYAPRLFGDLGAEVIRVEPPGGLPDRARALRGEVDEEAGFQFLNAGKSSIVLDLASNEGRSKFADLMSSTNVVFLERGAPLASEILWIRSLNSAAVITHVSPFGLGGPMEDAPSSDLTLQAAGGIAWLSGRPEDAPLRLPFNQATMVTSVYAAVATAISLLDAETTGRGHVIDVSGQECIAHSLQNALQIYDLNRIVSHRGGMGTQDASEGMFRCKDGPIFAAMGLGTGRSWVNFCAWTRETSHPAAEEFAKERWSDARWRYSEEAVKVFREHFEAFISNYTREQVMEETLMRGLLIAPVNRLRDLLDDRQLAYRKYFTHLTFPNVDHPVTFPGAPYKLSVPVWKTSPAPTLGQDNRRLAG